VHTRSTVAALHPAVLDACTTTLTLYFILHQIHHCRCRSKSRGNGSKAETASTEDSSKSAVSTKPVCIATVPFGRPAPYPPGFCSEPDVPATVESHELDRQTTRCRGMMVCSIASLSWFCSCGCTVHTGLVNVCTLSVLILLPLHVCYEHTAFMRD
jgi:hypothetical protein